MQQLLLMQQYADNQRIVVDVVTREEPGTSTQGGALFSLQPSEDMEPTQGGVVCLLLQD